jgi:tRNA(Ser,Leu) C12 N-acetylase TAN1
MDQERMARTEAAFREVNEAIAETAARFEAEEADFICECADPQCAHRVTAELEDYEEVRSEGTRFLLAHGHHEPKVERIVEHTEEFEVVEKVVPLMRRIVRRLNPRTA